MLIVEIEYGENKYGDFYGELVICYNGEEILRESDIMEPEDTKFCRDLQWIKPAIERAYKLGQEDGYKECFIQEQ